MEIRIRNLANIRRAKIELKNLTVFVGNNNTNKTWTAYLMYALAADVVLTAYFDILMNDPRRLKARQEFDIILSLLKKNRIEEEEATLYELINGLIEKYSSFVAKEFPHLLSLSSITTKQPLSLSLKFSKEEFKQLKSVLESVYKNQTIEDKIIFSSIITTLIGRPFNLPAERKALTTFPIHIHLGGLKIDQITNFIRKIVLEKLDKKEYDSFHEIITALIGLAKITYDYPIPVMDFKDFIINTMIKTEIDTKERDKDLYKELIELLESSLLEGKIAVNRTSKLIYVMKNNNTLDIPASSSMVKGLSGLDLYLKHRASPGDLLIIDEPEMNLHPEAQAKLIEFLTILTNKNIKVLITTHSPYIVDHLINLIDAYNSKKENVEDLFWEPKIIKEKKFKKIKPKDIFISKDSVSIYLFKDDGSVKDILDKKNKQKTGLTDWSNFTSTFEKISSIYSEI